jgi:hypothetical protein
MIDLFVGRGRRSATQCGRVVEYVLLEITECVALPVIAEIQQLILGDALQVPDSLRGEVAKRLTAPVLKNVRPTDHFSPRFQ